MQIVFDQVSKRFENGVTALENLSLTLRFNEFVSILGPSGCGKSTLLRLVAELDTPTSGKIISTLDRSQPYSFVFQDPHLLPWQSVERNVSLPLELLKVSPSEIQEKTLRILETVGLGEFRSAYPHQLSGGMRMRCSLARALVTEPEVLLLDEPFAALDEWTRLNLDLELRRLWERSPLTILFVTHNISEAVFLSNRSILMSARPGRVLEDLTFSMTAKRDKELRMQPEFFKEVTKIANLMEAEA